MTDPQKLYALLTEIYLILDDGNRRFLDEFNLTPARFYALLHLGVRSGISFSQLSGLMLCDKSNTSRIIKAMEASDLVVRQPHETDGRVYRLHLTEHGEALRRQVLTAHERYNQERFADNGVDDAHLIASLSRVKDSLKARLDGQAYRTG